VRKELERIDVPDEHEARIRSWEVVRAAFEAREPKQTPRSWRPLVVLVAAAALVAAVVSPPGRSVVDSIREAIGVESAQPALFSLPAEGQLLVSTDAGPWVVQRDGSRRLLGPYAEASWSPFANYVVAARADELAALEPDGDVRWKLSRPAVRLPRWGGTRTDTRIAYLSGRTLRVVAGDGTGDAELARNVAPVAPAWRPGARHVVAYVAANGRVRLVDVDTRRRIFRSQNRTRDPVALAWSHDGTSLASLGQGMLEVVLGDTGVTRLEGTGVAIAAQPRSASFAVVERLRSGLSRVSRAGTGRELFFGAGTFDGLAWSPNGRWLLVAWHDADQWVFVRAGQTPRIDAVSNVSAQFDGSFPRIEGWCCAR
jgi:hypothetical protein